MSPSAARRDQANQVVQSVWGDIETLDTLFADNLFLQVVNDQYYLTFGQMIVPLGYNPKSEKPIELRPVVRLVIPPKAMADIMSVLNRVTEKHLDPGDGE